MNWHDAGETAPQILVLPPAADNLDEAHAAIEQWEFYSRKALDPPQRLAVEVMMAETSSGRWAARTTGREMPRQNGKGDEIEVVEFWGLTQRGEAILHTAHELNTVSSAHQRMVALLSHRDFKGKRQPKIMNGLGQQSVQLGDAIVKYRTRTPGGGRGLDDISRLVIDEAQNAHPEQLASTTPILMANPNPQTNFLGTGGIEGLSVWWWQLRIRALGKDPGDFAYVGHTAERVSLDADGEVAREPVDADDRSLWRQPNPALVYGRAEMEFLEEQFRLLGPRLFAREHLCVWDAPPVAVDTSAFDMRVWAELADPDARPSGVPSFGVDVGADRLAHIGVAWRRADGGVQVSLTQARGRVDSGLSPFEAPKRLEALAGKWKGAVWLGGASTALAADVKGAQMVSAAEFASACGRFDDLVRERMLRHGNQGELNEAVRAARWRAVGQSGERALQLRDSPTVGPLAAVVRALHGLLAQPKRPQAPRQRATSPARRTSDLSSLSF